MKTNESRNKRAFIPSPGLSTSQDFPDSLLTILASRRWGNRPHPTLWAKFLWAHRVGSRPKSWPTGFRGLAHWVCRLRSVATGALSVKHLRMRLTMETMDDKP